MLDRIFENLGLSPQQTNAYLELLRRGPAAAGSLAKRLGVARSSLYGDLGALEQQGLIARSTKDPVTRWHAEDPTKIGLLLDRTINRFEDAKRQFTMALPQLASLQGADMVTPKFRFEQGQAGVRNILSDMLSYRDVPTEAFWPIQPMVEILGVDFFIEHNVRRIRQNLSIRAIWPQERVVDIAKNPFFGVGKGFLRDLRRAPSEIDCSMGYWAYANRVAFISSTRESFGFIVESTELRTMLKTQFELMWNVSAPIEINASVTQPFLQEHGLLSTSRG